VHGHTALPSLTRPERDYAYGFMVTWLWELLGLLSSLNTGWWEVLISGRRCRDFAWPCPASELGLGFRIRWTVLAPPRA